MSKQGIGLGLRHALANWLGRLLGLLVIGALLLPAPAWAADLQVSELSIEPCPAEDIGAQPELRRPAGASCYALRGSVVNPTRKPVVDTDVFALIVDSSGEPVLQNRTRVGSIGDVPPGTSAFALRLSVPAGTPGPLSLRNVKARGFSAPVRSRAGVDDELVQDFGHVDGRAYRCRCVRYFAGTAVWMVSRSFL